MQTPSRFLVIIDSGESIVARLYGPQRDLREEFDASSEEVALMTSGLRATRSGGGPEWDTPLAGHSASQRAHAEVYELDV